MPHDEPTIREVVHAMMNGDPQVIALLRRLVELSDNADAVIEPTGTSLLRLAVEHDHMDAIKELVKLGADLDMRSGPEGWTALHQAVDCDIDGVLQANPSIQVIDSVTLKMFGFEATRLLLRLGASTEIRNAEGDMPRQLAVRYHARLGEHFDEVVAST